ncbi:hypothetical protein [Dethiobacter alkaliphilus]|nr:hypothetical protein [Dethiobacter alkaliphilus]MCW3490961.1 hypothetical protein [Dethiobacter alkaliphilus]
MLFDVAAEIMEKLEKEFHEADPEEKERFIRSSMSLLKTVMGDSSKLI